MSSSGGPISGQLPAGQWSSVISDLGLPYYTLYYSIWTDAPGGQYQCWNALLPFPYSSGNLPQAIWDFS
jgi:hypothetical protein